VRGKLIEYTLDGSHSSLLLLIDVSLQIEIDYTGG